MRLNKLFLCIQTFIGTYKSCLLIIVLQNLHAYHLKKTEDEMFCHKCSKMLTIYGQASHEIWIFWAKWNLSYAPETVSVSYSILTIILLSLNTVGHMELKLCSKNQPQFQCKDTLTLTFDLMTTKSIGVFYPIWTIILWKLNILGQMELKLCSGNCFQCQGNSDLWLWDPKIKRGLLPNMDNHPIKFEYCWPNRT
jgi:hypothetical protein